MEGVDPSDTLQPASQPHGILSTRTPSLLLRNTKLLLFPSDTLQTKSKQGSKKIKIKTRKQGKKQENQNQNKEAMQEARKSELG